MEQGWVTPCGWHAYALTERGYLVLQSLRERLHTLESFLRGALRLDTPSIGELFALEGAVGEAAYAAMLGAVPA